MSRQTPQRHLVRPANRKPYWRGEDKPDTNSRSDRSVGTDRAQALKDQAHTVAASEPVISGKGHYWASQAETTKGEIKAKKSRHVDDPWGSAVRISVNGVPESVEAGVPSKVKFELHQPLIVSMDAFEDSEDYFQGVARLAGEQAEGPYPETITRHLEARFPEMRDGNGLRPEEEWIVEYGPVVATLDRYSELVQDRMVDNPRSIRHASRDAVRDLLDELGFDGAVMLHDGEIVAFDSDAVRFR